MSDDKKMTVYEAAEYMDVTPVTVNKYVLKYSLPCHFSEVNKRKRWFFKEEIDKWKKERERTV